MTCCPSVLCRSRIFLLPFVGLLLVLAGCDSGAAPPDETLPVIPGIEVIDEQGNRLGDYRKPAVPRAEGSTGCTRNPAFGITNLTAFPSVSRVIVARFHVPCPVPVELSIRRGRGPGESSIPALTRTLRQASDLSGMYQHVVDADALGLPDGFYRIHLTVGEARTWRDVWITADPDAWTGPR